MHRFEEKNGYLRMNLSGHLGAEEMKEWFESSKVAAQRSGPPPLVMVDLREMSVLPKEAIPMMEEAQRTAKKNGLVRSVVVVKSAILQMQFQRIAKGTGISDKERYISAETNPNWEKAAEDWLLSGIEPA